MSARVGRDWRPLRAVDSSADCGSADCGLEFVISDAAAGVNACVSAAVGLDRGAGAALVEPAAAEFCGAPARCEGSTKAAPTVKASASPDATNHCIGAMIQRLRSAARRPGTDAAWLATGWAIGRIPAAGREAASEAATRERSAVCSVGSDSRSLRRALSMMRCAFSSCRSSLSSATWIKKSLSSADVIPPLMYRSNNSSRSARFIPRSPIARPLWKGVAVVRRCRRDQ